MEPQLNRIAPLMPVGQYKTYGWSRPLPTHWVPATCEDIDCDAYLHGWVSTFDLSTELGQHQYWFCTHDTTRSHSEYRPGGTLVELTYPPGTTCFAAGKHQRPVGRPPVFFVRPGDWRGNPDRNATRIHTRARDWVDDFATHQDRLTAEIEKG